MSDTADTCALALARFVSTQVRRGGGIRFHKTSVPLEAIRIPEPLGQGEIELLPRVEVFLLEVLVRLERKPTRVL